MLTSSPYKVKFEIKKYNNNNKTDEIKTLKAQKQLKH